MKRLSLIFLLMFSVLSLIAAEKDDSWVPCIVKFEDGRTENGFIKDFMSVSEARQYSVYNANTGMSHTGMTRQKIFDKKFKFKTNESAKPVTIQRDEIQYVELLGEGEKFHFDKLNFKSLNAKGQPVGKGDTTFMLLHKDMDKVDVYVKTYLNANKLLDSPIYFKSVADDFAVPYFEIKMNVFTLMSSKKIKNEIYNSIKWVSRDCPEFQDYLNFYENMDTNKLSEKEMRESLEKYKGKTLIQQSQLAADAFVPLFEEYHEMCP